MSAHCSGPDSIVLGGWHRGWSSGSLDELKVVRHIRSRLGHFDRAETIVYTSWSNSIGVADHSKSLHLADSES